MSRDRQRGAGGVLIAVILVLLILLLLAARVLTRVGDAGVDRDQTVASLNRAADALDQYVAAAGAAARLPCPADPTADTGLEAAASSKTCTFDGGTLPWRTIGLRRDDAYDAWGRKLSYRVYTDSGSKGSLVQPGGPSLVNCYPDTNAGGGTDANGLCTTTHTTSTYDVLAKKQGLNLTDFGTEHSKNNNDPTAYVVISHGPTGLGGYTVSGAQLSGASGAERDNTRDTGPFTAQAWSDPDTAATSSSHFDDLLVYRTVSDLARKAGLQARSWGLVSLTFDAPTVTQGGGDTTTSDTGTSTLTFAGASGSTTITGFTGTTATDISYDTTTNANTGIGVAGGGAGSTNLISSFANESMQIKLGATSRQFAITLNDFSIYLGIVAEQAQLSFYKGNNPTPVLTVQKSACNTDGTVLSTLSINVGADFDKVVVKPVNEMVFGFPFDSSFAISAISACRSGVACTTAIAAAGVTCS